MAESGSRSGAPYCGWSSGTFPITQANDKVVVEYIYPDNTRQHLHVKTRVLDFEPQKASDCPLWDTVTYDNFAGEEPRKEMLVVPKALFRDPLRKGRNKIVVCEFWDDLETPTAINTRHPAELVMDKVKDDEPWFGMEQEYYIVDQDGRPLGWKPDPDFPCRDYHTAIGLSKTSGMERELADVHLRACLEAGVKICGLNREDAPAQWEYQIGPCAGIDIGDHMWVAKYLLMRVAEMFAVGVNFQPKLLPNSVEGASSCHLNFSTKQMRAENGIVAIKEAITKLSKLPQEKLLQYYDTNNGKDNAKRLTGEYFVPSQHDFTWGVGDKHAAVRIPTIVDIEKKGYFEERRPSSNCDPYAVIEIFVRATLLDDLPWK